MAQNILEQITPIAGIKARVIQTISEKSGIFLDIGPSDQGELGFAYFEWYDGPEAPKCGPGDVFLTFFTVTAVAKAADFERFVAGWSWARV